MKKFLLLVSIFLQKSYTSELPAASHSYKSFNTGNDADCSSSSSSAKDDVFIDGTLDEASKKGFNCFAIALKRQIEKLSTENFILRNSIASLKDTNQVLSRSNRILKGFLTSPTSLQYEAMNCLIFNLLEEIESLKKDIFTLRREKEVVYSASLPLPVVKKSKAAPSTDSLE